MNFLIDIVGEKYVAKTIFLYKEQMEYSFECIAGLCENMTNVKDVYCSSCQIKRIGRKIDSFRSSCDDFIFPYCRCDFPCRNKKKMIFTVKKLEWMNGKKMNDEQKQEIERKIKKDEEEIERKIKIDEERIERKWIEQTNKRKRKRGCRGKKRKN